MSPSANPVFAMLCASVLLNSLFSVAAAADAGRVSYRCIDAQGHRHFGDSMPPECQNQDTQVVDTRGNVVRVIDGPQSAALKSTQAAEEDQQRKKNQELAQHDHMLIDTYSSVDDLLRLRDQRLELLESQLKVTQQNIASLKERRSRLEQQVARFKPYNDKPKAPALPDHIAEELVNTVNSVRTYEQMIETKRAEQTELSVNFDRDIKRFKELKGIK